MIFVLKRIGTVLLAYLLLSAIATRLPAREPGDWSEIDRAVDSSMMWMALDAVTMGKRAGVVIFGRSGSLPYCEIRVGGRMPIRKSDRDIMVAFKLAIAQAYLH
jgi:hypothetical protein